MNDRIATIKSHRFEVRALSFDGRTFFCIKDILGACGIRYPSRWISRARAAHPDDIPMMKLMYPMMTKAGRREFAMWFVDADIGKGVIDLTNCTDDTKKWLLENVFTYRFQDPFTGPGDEADPPEYPARELPDLNGRIDSILFELLELKKIIAQAKA